MRFFYSSDAIRAADARAIEAMNIPGVVLMENAGRNATDEVLKKFGNGKKFLILCGPGNNGGDGFVMARHLLVRDRDVAVVVTTAPDKYRGDAALALAAYLGCGAPLFSSAELTDDELGAQIAASDVVVDALLGTGSSGAPRREVARLMCLIKKCAPASVVALDVPSGVVPDTGEASDDAVCASLTVTFLAEKVGVAVAPGALHCGEVSVADIGAPRGLVLCDEPILTGYDRTDIPGMAPHISRDAHKGNRGGLLIVGGSAHFRGAPLLAARAALRAGCGFVFLAVPDFMSGEASAYLPEAIVLPLPSDGDGIRASALGEEIAPWEGKFAAAVVGPGVGRSDGAAEAIRHFLDDWKKPLLMDADALFHLANMGAETCCNVVITPHTAEAARLLGIRVDEVNAHRLDAIASLAKKYGTALLKGPHTLIADENETRVVLEGGPELSVPGSGDVLSGAIGAYLARGLSHLDASTLGALVHALAGERLGRTDGVLAGEIADGISTEGSEK
ncbi:NAD(P)H-hydrate dehydratase [Synergistaceae bacterium OttesenSCG-928-I11]|nr:NAD(P)H-hydrate dehydratase [Synergistaceae bacterium OttesenSCG-928-I11]